MTESAKRERTLLAITRTALRLADEHGLDGFTLDQLAEEVGVSRRTLFNYVPSKIDAVLGPQPEPDPELVEAFVAGGPSGHLLQDLRAVASSFLGSTDTDQDLARFRRLLHADGRILQAAHARMQANLDDKIEVIRQREGADFPAEKARVAIHLVVGVCDLALDAFLADPETPLADHFNRVFDTLTALVED